MKKLILLLTLASFTNLTLALDYNWKDKRLWKSAVENNLHFFNEHAWEETSKSYASEIDVTGHQTSDTRDIVALARMIYANVKAPKSVRNLNHAHEVASFLINKMMTKDELGIYFKSAVDVHGNLPQNSDRQYTFIFEQAYAISGLTALYSEDSINSSFLLPIIRAATQGFFNRFWDNKNGGFFYYYNYALSDHSNSQGLIHKSYQSTIYPISSFLFELREADSEHRATYDQKINELLEIATTHIVEKENGIPTGWLNERMFENFSLDETSGETHLNFIGVGSPVESHCPILP
jgi:mannose/cellobiose epimerase-like protein (N-acyl-D-glucosamine 2-epimerase family)